MRIQSLCGEDPLEEEMGPHSSILAWKIPWTEEPGGLQSMGSQRVGHDLATKHHHHPELTIRLIFFPLSFLLKIVKQTNKQRANPQETDQDSELVYEGNFSGIFSS